MKSSPARHEKPRPAGPTRSIRIGAEPDEIYEFLSEKKNLRRWWFRPALPLDDAESERWHFQRDPSSLSIDVRWGGSGRWRHVRVAVEPEEGGARVAIVAHPVPGCVAGCLERESIRSARDLRRLRRAVEDRADLIDSENYWI